MKKIAITDAERDFLYRMLTILRNVRTLGGDLWQRRDSVLSLLFYNKKDLALFLLRRKGGVGWSTLNDLDTSRNNPFNTNAVFYPH